MPTPQTASVSRSPTLSPASSPSIRSAASDAAAPLRRSRSPEVSSRSSSPRPEQTPAAVRANIEKSHLSSPAVPSAATATQVPAPPTPQIFGLKQALYNRWAIAEGVLVTSEIFLWRAPTMFLPRLAPYCTTPALRGALVGACSASWLVLIPIVGLLAVQTRNKWQASIFEQRSEQFLTNLHARTDLYPRAKDLKAAVAAELADEGTYLAQQYTQFLTMTMACVAQVAAVGLQATSLPLGWPLVGAIAGVSVIAYLSRNVGEESIDGQTAEVRDARLKLANTGTGVWDNLVLDNELNRERWNQEYREHTQVYYREMNRGRLGAQLQQVLFSLQWMLQSSLSASSALYSTCFPERGPLLSSNQNASLVNLASLVSLAVQLSPLRRQYKDLINKRDRSEQHMRDICEVKSFEDVRKNDRIHIDSPQGQGTATSYLQNLEQFASKGLHTVRGDNGSGKSLLLLDVKKHFGDRALYIPAKHELNFPIEAGSTGQMVARQFSYLDTLNEKGQLPEIILLDEWDANLDDSMRAKLQQTIERWQKNHAVVQIVHR